MRRSGAGGRGAAPSAGQDARRAALHGLRGATTNPLAWSIVLGGLSTASGLRLPAPALRVVEMLADAASPAALFTIGPALARSRVARRRDGHAPARRADVPTLVALKLIVHPALVYAVGRTAIALGAPLRSTARIARLVLVTTVLAFGTFPAVVHLLGG